MKKPYWLVPVVFVVLTVWFVMRNIGEQSLTSSSQSTPTVTTLVITKGRWSDPVKIPDFSTTIYGATEESVCFEADVDGKVYSSIDGKITVEDKKQHHTIRWRLSSHDAKPSREFAYYFVPQGTK